MKYFNGKKIRDEILVQLKGEVAKMKEKPYLRVFWVGNNEVSGRYVVLKNKVAKDLGVKSEVVQLDQNIKEKDLLSLIEKSNSDPKVSGIMIQIPLPLSMNRDLVMSTIDPKKDIDGLRICTGLESSFYPPVVLAIREAIKRSKKNIKKIKTVIVGKGFLVGGPLEKSLKNEASDLIVLGNSTKNLAKITREADILISATGVGGIIKPEMVKEGVVLIDAGTSEIGGKFIGDIMPECYLKADYFTPVPGGIGPVTIAMLMKNLVNSKKLI